MISDHLVFKTQGERIIKVNSLHERRAVNRQILIQLYNVFVMNKSKILSENVF